MDSFRWVSVLLSMVLGLGIANLLNGLVGVFRARRSQAPDWLPLAWAASIFIAHLQFWWAINQMPHGLPHADIGTVIGLVVFALLLSAAAVLLLPGRDTPGQTLRQHFEADGRWALASLSVFLLTTIVVNWMLFDTAPTSRISVLTVPLALAPLLVVWNVSRRLSAAVTALCVPLYVVDLFTLSRDPLPEGSLRWLSVMISMILGLGVARLLTGLVVVFRARGSSRLDWLPLVWAANIFVVQLQYWWAVNNLPPDAPPFTFPTFIAFLLLPTLLYLAAALLLPAAAEDEPAGLYAYFQRAGRWALALLAAYLALAEAANALFFDVPLASTLTLLGLPTLLLPLVVVFARARWLRAAVTIGYLPLLWLMTELASYGY